MLTTFMTRIKDARIANKAAAITRRELNNLTRRDLEDIGIYGCDINRIAHEAGLAAVAEARAARARTAAPAQAVTA